MEACGGAHDWAHRFQGPGHDIQLMPPSYVKPYVKRGKTNAADAAAIFEAVRRPSMLLAAAKSQACTSVLVLNRARDLLVRQRTQIGNAIRAHITEFGVIAAKGAQNVDRLRTQLLQLPEVALSPVSLLFEQLVNTNTWTEQLTCEIEATHAQYETCQRLATIPGVGTLDCARDYAVWLGLTPKPHTTGGKQRMRRISKMGNRYIRRPLYLGAMSQIIVRSRCGPKHSWLSDMLVRKKMKVVAIALARRMARTIFAVLRDG